MSRSTFLTATSSFDGNETPSISPTTNDSTRALRFHHRLMPTISTSNRSNEILPVLVVQSISTVTTDTKTTTTNITQHKSMMKINPTVKRNLRGKRRSTGIRPEEVTLATAALERSFNQDDEQEDEEDKTSTCNQFITITSNESSESFDPNRKSPPKPVFKVSRIQPTFDENSHRSFEKLTITRPDPFAMASSSSATTNIFPNASTKMFRSEEFILRRQPSDDESSSPKRRQAPDESIRTLESLIYEKDSLIHDLQHKLERKTRDLNDAEQQIYTLQRDKLTLIKSLSTLQDNPKPSSSSSPGTTAGDHSTSTKRPGFVSRN